MRVFDGVILRAKLQDFIIESRKNIDSKIRQINNYLYLMKEENEQMICKGKQK